jgi:phosphoribosyl 1,2-cyclic phosphodiesterase
MKLTFLGTASGMPDIDRNSSAILVEAGDWAFLVDAGEGVARCLLRSGNGADRIDAVFISHTHADHAAGIPGLLQWMLLCGRTKPLSIFLPAGILRRFKSVIPAFLLNQGKWTFKFHLFPMAGGLVYEKDAFRIEAVPNSHLAPGLTHEERLKKGLDCYSFCFYESIDRKAVYTSDVDGLDHLGAVAAMTNLLVAECTHVEVEDVLDFTRQNRIGRVIFTHIPSEMRLPISSSPDRDDGLTVVFAKDGDAFEV